MRNSYLALLLLLLGLPTALRAQTGGAVGIGTSTPDPKAALDIRSTDKGLLIPRLTEAQRLGMGAGLPAGLMVFQTDGPAPGFWYYFGGQWNRIPTSTAGDNLGNHTATQNLGLNGRWLSNDGGNEGLRILDNGNVGIGTGNPSARLDVSGSARVRDAATVGGDLTVQGTTAVGWMLVTSDDAIGGNSRGQFVLLCPAGMRVLGGGGGHRDWNAAASDITVNYSGPDPAAPETRWRLIVSNTSTSSRAVRLYCTCARVAP
ncbi:hypothetical protein GCM10027048_23900 [Hymenobacter coalescens]